MAMRYHDGMENEFNNDENGALHDIHDRWRRQATLGAMEGTSPLRLHVASDSPELSAIHEAAQPRAMFYITIILTMYLFGLILIFIHYMNSSYGKWTWTLSDAWDELTPAFFNQSQNDMTGSYSDSKQKRSVSERNGGHEEGEEEEARFLPSQFGEHNWKTNLDSSNVSSGCSGQTGLTSLPSEEEEECCVKDKKKPNATKAKKFLSPPSARPKKFCATKSTKEASEANSRPCSEYQTKPSGDETVLSATSGNTECNNLKAAPNIKVSSATENKDEDIIVITDEIH